MLFYVECTYDYIKSIEGRITQKNNNDKRLKSFVRGSPIFKEIIHRLIDATILLISACVPSSVLSLTGRLHPLVHNSPFVNFNSNVL